MKFKEWLVENNQLIAMIQGAIRDNDVAGLQYIIKNYPQDSFSSLMPQILDVINRKAQYTSDPESIHWQEPEDIQRSTEEDEAEKTSLRLRKKFDPRQEMPTAVMGKKAI